MHTRQDTVKHRIRRGSKRLRHDEDNMEKVRVPCTILGVTGLLFLAPLAARGADTPAQAKATIEAKSGSTVAGTATFTELANGGVKGWSTSSTPRPERTAFTSTKRATARHPTQCQPAPTSTLRATRTQDRWTRHVTTAT